jgi:hypothetical protein
MPATPQPWRPSRRTGRAWLGRGGSAAPSSAPRAAFRPVGRTVPRRSGSSPGCPGGSRSRTRIRRRSSRGAAGRPGQPVGLRRGHGHSPSCGLGQADQVGVLGLGQPQGPRDCVEDLLGHACPRRASRSGRRVASDTGRCGCRRSGGRPELRASAGGSGGRRTCCPYASRPRPPASTPTSPNVRCSSESHIRPTCAGYGPQGRDFGCGGRTPLVSRPPCMAARPCDWVAGSGGTAAVAERPAMRPRRTGACT